MFATDTRMGSKKEMMRMGCLEIERRPCRSMEMSATTWNARRKEGASRSLAVQPLH